MLGRGPTGNNATCWALGGLSVTSPATHKQIGPFRCWLPGGWVCVRSRILWISSKDYPVRLGVLLPLQPIQFFIARGFEALVSHSGTLGYAVRLIPQLFFPAYLHVNVGYSSPTATVLPTRFAPASSIRPSYWSGSMFLL